MQNVTSFMTDDNTGDQVENTYLKAEIELDQYPDPPNSVSDCMGRLVAGDKGSRYCLGAELSLYPDTFEQWIEETKENEPNTTLYVDKYDRVSFAIELDAYEKKKMWGEGWEKRTEAEWLATAEGIAKEWRAYWEGECYQWTVTDTLKGKVIDSCGGFYGYDSAKESLAGEGYLKYL